MRLFVAVVAAACVAVTVGTATIAVGAQSQTCEFQLGFKALHDLIPGVVSDCLSNEVANPETGDALQETVGGLLVWRKSDNWTAFTDGNTTWINGPEGLVSRSNNGPLFPWEGQATVASGIDGVVTIGSSCPGPAVAGTGCQQPYKANLTVLDLQGRVISQVDTDEMGHFHVQIPPGTYVIHPNPPANLPLPFGRDQTVTIAQGQFTSVQITYESGIR